MAESIGYRRKIKVFLGAYVNQTNAQNLNCRQLATHLDKSKFKVYALQIKHGDLPFLKLDGVKTFICYFPVKVTGLIGYFWGIMRSDIVYLPRADFLRWQIFLLKTFRRKSFKTIENIIDDLALQTALSVPKRRLNDFLDYYKYCDQNHPITKFVGDYNLKTHGLKYDLPVLRVPTDVSFFKSHFQVREVLKRVVFIGSDFRRKQLVDFVRLANRFESLEFILVGRGDAEPYILDSLYDNLKYKGELNHESLVELLDEVDLHFFPSKSEGFGKVTIECAAVGIPSIVYDCYGANEWIKENEGFVVSDFESAVRQVESILTDPSILTQKSYGCAELADRFASENVVPIYEHVIEDLYAS